MPEEEQNLSAAMRVARRSVWEQAKAAGIQNDETPPPVPTGKETGLNDDPRIATLEGIVRDLAGRLDDLEDDFPEQENGVGDGASFDVAGTPALFKVCALVGWTLDSEGEWTQMTIDDMVSSPPTELWEGQTEPGNYLRPTWDWVRAYEET